MAEKNYITPDGYRRLVDELTELAVVERPRVVREVSDAAAEGDRSENAAYIYGKRRLREIDRRLGFLKRRLEFVQVVKADESRQDRVFFGAWVEVEDEEGETHVYQIVGVDEVEAEKGRISWKSPIGHALIGKQLDESFVVKWHAGQRELTIVDIRYRQHPEGESGGDRGEAEANEAPPTSRPPRSAPSGAEESTDAGEDEPFESDEDAERAAQFRARQTAKKKPAKAASKARAPKHKAAAKPKAAPKPGAPADAAARAKAPANGKAAGKPAASASRVASIKAAADVKAAKKP